MISSPENFNVAAAFIRSAKRNPAASALILRDRTVSYQELLAAVHVVADTLIQNDIHAGDVVGMSMAQTPLHLVSLLALAYIGAVSVPVHAMIPEDRRRLAATRYGIKALVSGRADLQLSGIPFIDLSKVDLGQRVLPPTLFQATADSPFRIVLSSGTSGDPKGVMYSHRYMLDRMEKTNYACTPLSRILPMDLNFPIGFVFALGMLMVGGSVVFPPGNDPGELIRSIRLHGVTHWLVSPAQAETIAGLLPFEGLHFPTLVHLRIVGDTPSERLLNTLREKFSTQVFLPYGSTEMGVISMADPDILRQFPNSSGRLMPWMTAEVVDENDQPLPPGQIGRLRLKTEGMLQGYHLSPRHTEEKFRQGWYYPGDLARIDSQGLLFIEGREDDVINVAGTKIRPKDVESTLQSHPGVRDAAAFALSDARGATSLCAAVILREPVSLATLKDYAVEKLGPLSPAQFFVVSQFPRNTNGKLLREQLALQVQQASAPQDNGRLH